MIGLGGRIQRLSRSINFSLFILALMFGLPLSTVAFATPTALPTGKLDCQVTIANVSTNIGGSGLSGTSGNIGGTGQNPFCVVLAAVNQLLEGSGKAIATVAIIAVGAAALFGKITWGQSLVVVTGLALVFGADNILTSLGSKDSAIGVNIVNASVSASFGGITISAGNNGQDPISLVLFTVIQSMIGPGGRAIAIFAIAVLGVGAFFGKISWPQALGLAGGVALVFGAANLVQNVSNAFTGLASIDTLYGSITSFLNDDVIAAPFMNVVEDLTGPTGIAIAIIGVMAVGFAAMFGKVSWVRALLLACGIGLIFGAADVVYILSSPFNNCAIVNADPFTQVICGFLGEIQGPMGKSIAMLAIIIVGILTMLGKVSWELGFIVTIGIALIFGADAIVNIFETGLNGITCGTSAPAFPSGGSNAIADTLCYIVMILYGPAGKALATVSVIMMGFGALMGKVSYSQAFVVAAGIAVTFGAPQIVTILLPSANTSGCSASTDTGGVLSFGGITISTNGGNSSGCSNNPLSSIPGIR